MQDQPLLEQIDWFFSSVKWISIFPNTMVKPMARPILDHVHRVLSVQITIPRSKIFRFKSFWPSNLGFFEIVQASWAAPTRATSSATSIAAKMKRLRYALKKWSKKLSKLRLLIENNNKFLLQMDNLEELRQLTIRETNFQKIPKNHIFRLLRYQNTYWKK